MTLRKIVHERIRQEGRITFAEFMRMALYHPGLGYYASDSTEIGKEGDFYTSPHLHPIFGALLGVQAVQMWEILGRPADFTIAEPGPGRGFLCKDMLDYLKDKDLYGSLSYVLVELNPAMKKRQGDLLGAHRGVVRWADAITELAGMRGLVVSNEVLDALPVHLIRMGDAVEELYVESDGESFVETYGPPSTHEIERYLEEFSVSIPRGYRTEVNLELRRWLGEVSSAVSEGFVLAIDYGHAARDYYSEERDRGTLLCYHRHTVCEDPLKDVGRQDITAHVNFSSLKRWGEESGLRCVGYCRQGPFLVSLGIDALISKMYGGSQRYEEEVSKIKGLILPGGMGESHKVMAQYKGPGNPTLMGFRLSDQSGRV